MPGGARLHDVVVVFFGCSCPMLLRPVGDNFKVVSHCYVQGIMDGEVVHALEDLNRNTDYSVVDIDLI